MDIVLALSSVLILLHSAHTRSVVPKLQVESASNTSKGLMKVAAHRVIYWLCIDNMSVSYSSHGPSQIGVV